VVQDSGPAIGVPHPLNTDVVPAQDITVVPPGASFYAGNQQGLSMSVEVEFSKEGRPDLMQVGASMRERRQLTIAGPSGPITVQGLVCTA